MVLNREEFFARLAERTQGDVSDAGLKFLEDMTDTYNDMERRASSADPTEALKELDAQWRRKYTERFFSGDSAKINIPGTDKPVDDGDFTGAEITIDELFSEKT